MRKNTITNQPESVTKIVTLVCGFKKSTERLKLSGNTPWHTFRWRSLVNKRGMSAPSTFNASRGRPAGPRVKHHFAEWIYISVSVTSALISEKVKLILLGNLAEEKTTLKERLAIKGESNRKTEGVHTIGKSERHSGLCFYSSQVMRVVGLRLFELMENIYCCHYSQCALVPR